MFFFFCLFIISFTTKLPQVSFAFWIQLEIIMSSLVLLRTLNRSLNRDLCMSLRAKDFRRLADLTKICLYNHLRLPPPAESPYFDMLLAAFNTYVSINEGKVLQLINREPGALSGFTTLQDKAFLTLLDNAPTGKSEMPKGLRFLDQPSSKEEIEPSSHCAGCRYRQTRAQTFNFFLRPGVSRSYLLRHHVFAEA